MKAVLINPYVPVEVIYGKTFAAQSVVLPPLGILYLASYLKDKYNVEVLDANALRQRPADVEKYIFQNDFDCVGFSVTTLSYPYAVEIAENIRKASAGIKLVIGGVHAQGDYKSILSEYPGLFDFVCYGEGEYALESLLDYLSGKVSKEKLLGWSYLENGNMVTTQVASIPENLDIFGHPAEVISRDYVKLYHEKILAYKELPMFSVITSRGCPFQCTFCSTPQKFNSLYNKKIRYHSVEWICDELMLLKEKYGVREVIFVDDTFNFRRERILEFCEAILKKNIRIKWTCNFKAHISDIEMLKKMKKAGCWGIMIGAESGSNEILKLIKKGVTTEQVRLVGEMADSVGIFLKVSFIIGLAGDTKETIEKTISFAKSPGFHFPYFQLYIPLPGTEMFNQLPKYGRIINLVGSKKTSVSSVNFIPNGLTEEYLLDAFNRAYKEVYLRWQMVGNHLKFIRSFTDLKHYLKGLRLLAQI